MQKNASLSYWAIVDSETLCCGIYTALYTLNVSYPKGNEQISYSTNDSNILERTPIFNDYTWYGDPWPWNSTHGDMAYYPQKLQK